MRKKGLPGKGVSSLSEKKGFFGPKSGREGEWCIWGGEAFLHSRGAGRSRKVITQGPRKVQIHHLREARALRVKSHGVKDLSRPQQGGEGQGNRGSLICWR